MQPVSLTKTTTNCDEKRYKATSPTGVEYLVTLVAETHENVVEMPVHSEGAAGCPRHMVTTTMSKITRREVDRTQPHPCARPERVVMRSTTTIDVHERIVDTREDWRS
ncbi:hypothetical protein AURDEDRAFT_172367 [Auricularia subglabra TFB-10046 SS5]|nr:hypothetical protein AURDEDRAFT_172367 [Auricularia subglabra TFB-10046 SS5]